MLHRKNLLAMTAAVALLLLPLCQAWANKSSTTITAPERVKQGDAVTVTIKVMHEGNNIFHHTDWLRVMVNGEEKYRWDFGWLSLPPSNNFSKEITITVSGTTEIVAEAACNVHGSEPASTLNITVNDQQSPDEPRAPGAPSGLRIVQ